MSHTHNTQLIPVVKKYLEVLKVPFTAATLKKYLLQSPYYPTLYGISSILSKYNVPNEAFVVEQEQLSLLEPPFLTYYSGQVTGKDFILVTGITDTQVTYYGEEQKEKQVAKENFLRHWEKIILVAEPSAASREPGYDKHRKKEINEAGKRTAWITAAALIVILLAANFYSTAGNSNPLLNSMLLLSKIAGVAISVLLLVYDYDKTNSFVKNICSTGRQTGCDAVVNSRAGKIFGIKWSEAGFFYFAATFLFLLYPGISLAVKIPFLALAATAVSPYIIFSVYYQARIAKQWCPLCLSIQFVLLVELVWAIFSYWQQPVVPAVSVPLAVGFITSILIPVLAWFAFKKTLYQAKDAGVYEAAYKRLLYNPEQFNQLLQQQDTAADGWQQLGINIGNPNAGITIVKVCNPYCGPCAKAHPVLEELVKENNNVNVKIIFTASNDEKDKGRKPVSHLLAIAESAVEHQVEQALDDWYLPSEKNYESFALKYPKNGELARQGEKITAMKEWCDRAAITHTPTFFINGKRLPETYRIEELKNIF